MHVYRYICVFCCKCFLMCWTMLFVWSFASVCLCVVAFVVGVVGILFFCVDRCVVACLVCNWLFCVFGLVFFWCVRVAGVVL